MVSHEWSYVSRCGQRALSVSYCWVCLSCQMTFSDRMKHWVERLRVCEGDSNSMHRCRSWPPCCKRVTSEWERERVSEREWERERESEREREREWEREREKILIVEGGHCCQTGLSPVFSVFTLILYIALMDHSWEYSQKEVMSGQVMKLKARLGAVLTWGPS